MSAAFVAALIAGCAPASAAASTPSPVPSSIPSTIEPDALLLDSNQPYRVIVAFSLPRATLHITNQSSAEPLIVYQLQAQNSPPEPLRFALVGNPRSGWGIPYMIHALNQQVENWDRPDYVDPETWYSPYWAVKGSLVLSPDERTMAYTSCGEHGGRGQWCSDAHVWFFDLQTGETRQADFGDYTIRYTFDPHFSDDSQTLTATGCLNYPNAYFGWCGDTAAMTWDVSTGQLLDLVVTPEV